MPRRPSAQQHRNSAASVAAAAPREIPKPPPRKLGRAGRQRWAYVWAQEWIRPERHLPLVERYCLLTDLLDMAMQQIKSDGFMVQGSRIPGQLRCHQALVEVRAISTECRLIEAELGLSPASESKAAVPALRPPNPLDEMEARRRATAAALGIA